MRWTAPAPTTRWRAPNSPTSTPIWWVTSWPRWTAPAWRIRWRCARLLDHALVEWAATVPADLKLRSTGGKYIFKRALEPYVPHENIYRTKQGFATSLAPQFRGLGA